MWGSNFPNTDGEAPATEHTYASLVNRVVMDVSHFGEDVRHALLGGTALKQYPAWPDRSLPKARVRITRSFPEPGTLMCCAL